MLFSSIFPIKYYYTTLLWISSISGFTTTSDGRTNIYYSIPGLWSNRYDRPSATGLYVPPRGRYRSQDCQAYERGHAVFESSTTLRLSISAELPAVSDIVSTYTYCLKYHYFPTQSMTNAILTVVGDGIAQSHESNLQHASSEGDNILDPSIDGNTESFYDPKRGLVYFFKGLGSGVMWAWWFDMAEFWSAELTQSALSFGSSNFDGSGFQQFREAIVLANSSTGTDALSSLAQTIRTAINILSEQFLVCPIWFSLWDIPVTSLMRGCPARQFPAQIRGKLVPLLVANAKVWTLVNVVTYNIPLEYRLLFTSAASIVSESMNAGITSKEVVVPETPKPTSTVADAQQIYDSAAGMEVDTMANANSFVPSAANIARILPLVSSNSGDFDRKNLTLVEL